VTPEAVKFGEADLTTCDREPIHIPGSIQPHGVLLVLDRQTLNIEQVAGDASAVLAISDDRFTGMPLSAVLDAEAVNFVAGQLDSATENVAPAMRMNARSKTGAKPLHLTLHALGRTAIVELEPVRHRSDCKTEAFAVFGADGGQCRRMLRRRRNFSAQRDSIRPCNGVPVPAR
jgi:light-regulated signal transduction histidine kinase (bacteriophytochrome)